MDPPNLGMTNRIVNLASTWFNPLTSPEYLLVYSYLNILQNNFICLGDLLEDFPDSPGGDGGLTREAASRILDTVDAMETGHAGDSSPPSNPSGASASHKRPLHSSLRLSGTADSKGPKMGPSLPPIYHSVLRKKLAKMTVRHLDGGACKDDDCTSLGASVYEHTQVGSFCNPNDKRHNHTIHRHDHQSLRNISTSFDPVSFN